MWDPIAAAQGRLIPRRTRGLRGSRGIGYQAPRVHAEALAQVRRLLLRAAGRARQGTNVTQAVTRAWQCLHSGSPSQTGQALLAWAAAAGHAGALDGLAAALGRKFTHVESVAQNLEQATDRVGIEEPVVQARIPAGDAVALPGTQVTDGSRGFVRGRAPHHRGS